MRTYRVLITIQEDVDETEREAEICVGTVVEVLSPTLQHCLGTIIRIEMERTE